MFYKCFILLLLHTVGCSKTCQSLSRPMLDTYPPKTELIITLSEIVLPSEATDALPISTEMIFDLFQGEQGYENTGEDHCNSGHIHENSEQGYAAPDPSYANENLKLQSYRQATPTDLLTSSSPPTIYRGDVNPFGYSNESPKCEDTTNTGECRN